MHTTIENNVEIEFLNSEIIHVTLNAGGLFTTQLLRELQVISKVKNGKIARAYIITIADRPDVFEYSFKICKKIERIDPEITVALVYNKSYSQLKTDLCAIFHTHTRSPRIFDNFSSALVWVNSDLTTNTCLLSAQLSSAAIYANRNHTI